MPRKNPKSHGKRPSSPKEKFEYEREFKEMIENIKSYQ